jgi:hypothetical protein
MTARAYSRLYDDDEGRQQRRARFFARMETASQLVSESPPSNDNQKAPSNIPEIDEVEKQIEAQHAHIGKLMHSRNADPKNQELKQNLDHAFVKLEQLEERRAFLLRPYLAVKAPSFSEEERRIIEEAERLRIKYGG